MQRIVYSPRVYAFVKDADGNIRDISRYITAGSVNRRIGAVSSAELTLRNPKMLFTTPDSNGRTAFTPMDPITIYLKRVDGRPVRVFTGFLDRTPYLTLYPGTVTLKASCTLKRLLYTFFDPALPYTQSFLAAYGWINKNGTVFSLNGFDDWDTQVSDTEKNLNDGSIAALLYATLKHIGNWHDKSILIEKLPPDLFTRMAALYKEISADNKQLADQVEELMRRIVGEGDFGGGGNSVDLSGIDGNVAEVIYQVGQRMKVPYRYMLAAFETGLVESNMRNLNYGDADSKGWRQERVSIYGEKHATSVELSAEDFFKECKQLDSGQSAGELAADVQRPATQYRGRYADERDRAVTLLRKTQQRVNDKNASNNKNTSTPQNDPNSDQSTTKVVRAKSSSDKTSKGTTGNHRWVYPLNKQAKIIGVPYQGTHTLYGNWQSDNAVDLGCDPGTKWIAVEDGVISPGGMGYGNSSGTGGSTVYGYRLTLVGKSGNQYFYQHGGSDLAPQGAHVKQGDVIGSVGDYRKNGIPTHLHFASKPPTDPRDVIKSAPITGGGTNQTGGGSGGGSSGFDPSNPQAIGTGAALAASFDFPTLEESLEAVALQGEKSLMNDKPLLPFIQQLCEASLREFQSLPDGKFFAFYPDYFGEMFHRPPYWEIDDIEILDGKIELTDDALVTHMYVVGDTTWPSSNQMLNDLFSAGVITIFNAFLSDSILNRPPNKADKADNNGKGPAPITPGSPRGMNLVLSKDEAVTFLNRYGARPLVEDMPMVHSPYFEMFLAYQRFMLAWSKQFSTPFAFTFMPELYPGGKVGFPDHGLQLYIEEVTHTFDYTSGFMTQASLSAPSVYTKVDDNGKPVNASAVSKLPPNMVKAIIDNPTKTANPGPKNDDGTLTARADQTTAVDTP